MKAATNEKISITVCNWFDTVTPESATDGDYESTGNEMRSFDFNSLRDAAAQFVCSFENGSWENNGDGFVNDVQYGVDPDTDYSTGAEDYDRLIISVDSKPSIKPDRQKPIERALNYLISKKLAA